MEIRKQLNKYKLDFQPTIEYVRDDLDHTNSLSSELLELSGFNKGTFFTLLPDDADLSRMYEFKWGGILPQNSEIEYLVDGIKSTYSLIPNIEDQLSDLISVEMIANDRTSCVFDKVTGSRNNNYYIYYSDVHPMFYKDEVYFHLDKQRASYELIKKCLKASTSFWHSLCVLTEADFSGVEDELTLEKIREICLKTKLFMIGAYDSEGYVFWEKSGNHFFENTVGEA